MKFKASCENTAKYRRNQIRARLYKSGLITLYEVKEMFGETTDESDHDFGWGKGVALERKIRVRETKKGWFLYLPEPSKMTWDEEKMNINPETYEKPVIGDITVIETDALEQLIKELEGIKVVLAGNCGYVHRPCTVKAKKSGLKEERQDRKAWFHRWADLSKGVQQVVGIVEFDDGHVEQVRPDRIIFDVKEEE